MSGFMWLVLVLTATSPLVLFYATSTEPTPKPVPLVFKIRPPEWLKHPSQSSQTPQSPIPRSKVSAAEDRSEEGSLPASYAMIIEPFSEEAFSTPTSAPPLPVIYEKPERNGTPGTAQEIAACTLIGQRGTEDDHADFYKIRATGETMVLQVDASCETLGLRMSVFDDRERVISEGAEKTGRVTVKPQETYYIKLHLVNVPVASPQYKVCIRFENGTQSPQNVNRLSQLLTPGEENPVQR